MPAVAAMSRCLHGIDEDSRNNRPVSVTVLWLLVHGLVHGPMMIAICFFRSKNDPASCNGAPHGFAHCVFDLLDFDTAAARCLTVLVPRICNQIRLVQFGILEACKSANHDSFVIHPIVHLA